jgi:pilus assembly protein CpaE
MFVLPAPLEIEDAELIGHDEVQRALDLLRARCRYTVVDTPRTITGSTAAALEASSHVLVLADLSIPGVRAARRLFDLITKLGVSTERIHLVITEAEPGPVTVQEAAEAIGTQPYCVVPRDEATAAAAMNQGVPLNGKPSKLATSMTELAAKIAGIEVAPKPGAAQLIRRIMSFRPQEAYA